MSRRIRFRFPFPESFLFGVATSDHQSEAFDPRFPDIWDAWEQQRGLTPRGRAADFWNRYPEDVQLARSLGCRAFRFSVAWSRVEPSPGRWNPEAIEHYRDVIRAIRSAGMEPIVTLLHWTWPLWVEEQGGLTAAGFPMLFERYTGEIARRLGEGVRYWVTLNEPNALPFGYFKLGGRRHYPIPPGLDGEAGPHEQVEAVARLIPNLFRAHAAARAAIRAERPEAKVGANPCLLGLPPWLQRWADWRLTHSRDAERWCRREERSSRGMGSRKRAGRFVAAFQSLGEFLLQLWCFSTLMNPNWWHLGMAGRLPPYLCPPECVGAHDYVGIDYYWGIPSLRLGSLLRLIDTMEQQFDRAPIWPRGLSHALIRCSRLFPGMEILVLENGCIERADGIGRAECLRRHLREVARAIRHGANVAGYCAWCVTTSREWGLPLAPWNDFGLFHVDLDGDPDLRRHPTPAAKAYADVIAARATPRRRRSTLRREEPDALPPPSRAAKPG